MCRRLKPVVGRKVDRIWAAYVSESDPQAKASLVQALELLAVRHLDQGYQPDRSPFPPPPREFADRGSVTLGQVTYAGKELFPFSLRADRLKEHMLICGRSGSGKTNLTFLLMRGLMDRGIHVLAMDWKRGYRDLLQVRDDLRVYTIGREISPFRFNPFIPPPGIEAGHWGKLVIDVIASAYFGGEGVISLLVSGLDHLYHECGAHEGLVGRWPVVADLLTWLRETKLTGRAAMWKASAERILVAMTYGEFGAVLDCQDNRDVRGLLNHNVVLEMDGLSSNSDRVLFSEALTLYLYRQRLVEGPRKQLDSVVILEEAHNLLLGRQPGSRESVLENSIRMIRQYGLGYVFVDQSASMLSKVAFANSYATVALSQKLKGDVQAMASAMNLGDEQRQALSTLPVGSAVVRLADEHPEPFLIQAPLCDIQEGLVGDDRVARSVPGDSGDSGSNTAPKSMPEEITALPPPDKKGNSSMDPEDHRSHPPPETSTSTHQETSPTDPPMSNPDLDEKPAISREMIRFLHDLATRPLSTTVNRYQRLRLSRRKGNAIRKEMISAGFAEAVRIPTRSGQVILLELTDTGRAMCRRLEIDPGPAPRESLEHRYWVARVAERYEAEGYAVALEKHLDRGFVDILAARDSETMAVEIETGKSDIAANIQKLADQELDEILLVATSPAAVTACEKIAATTETPHRLRILSWLDFD